MLWHTWENTGEYYLKYASFFQVSIHKVNVFWARERELESEKELTENSSI